MDKISIKKNLFEKCLLFQNEVINNLKNLMSEAQQSANEYGPPKDRYDSYRMQLLRKRDMYGQQLEKAINEFELLKKLNTNTIFKEVCFGSVVFTKTQKLFISISVGKIELDGDIYYAVSGKVPFYESIKGKKKNDNFTFRDEKNQIIDVF